MSVLAGIEGLVANVLDRVQQRQALTKAQAEQEEEQDLRRRQQLQEEEQHGQERWGPRWEKIHAAASRVKGGLGSSQSVDGTLRGSLSSLLYKFGKFSDSVIRLYTYQLLTGLEYLHRHRIIHRDIKGANILVNESGLCKLADFGASVLMEGIFFFVVFSS
jgi:thiamine kinase-like enzyme